jgi:amidohydrolase
VNLSDGIAKFIPKLIQIRRDIHAHPELSYNENRTSDVVAAALTEMGLTVHRGMGKTGVVGTLTRGNKTGAIGLRADMDALPVPEGNLFSHASKYKNIMHACGHDGHTTMLLGGAMLLADDPNFEGTVHFIFQPAEEGGAGAKAMMDDGLFTKFPMDAVFGLHNWPLLPAGQFAVRVGPIMAAGSVFEIRVEGRGAHAAQPHTSIDPIPILCAMVSQLQLLVSRNLNPVDVAVLTIGQIVAGTRENIIPSHGIMKGTLRTLSAATAEMMQNGMRRICEHTALAHNATATLTFNEGYPATVNHAAETKFAGDVIASLVGEGALNRDTPPNMTAEDFSFMLEAVPGCYALIGNGGASGSSSCYNLHNPNYDFNDDIIGLGASYWAQLSRQWFARAS